MNYTNSITRHHRRAGFTLLEVMIALVLMGILSFAIWSIAEAAGRKQLQTFRQVDASNAIVSSDFALKNELQDAGGEMLSTANFGAVHVKVVDAGGIPEDTLYVLNADGTPVRNASRPCRNGGSNCILLLGNQTERYKVGDLVVAGSPSTGARIFQVVSTPTSYTAACGADCGEVVLCSYTVDAPSNPRGDYVEVITAEINGGPPQPGETCGLRQPYSLTGSCTEQLEGESFRRYLPYCNATSQPTSLDYTEVQVADRTSTTFGYPLSPIDIRQSSGSGTPKIQTQEVSAMRFWVRNAGTANGYLVRQTSVQPDGTWGAAIPIGGPITSLQVETLHRDETTWTRGVGITEGMLQLTSPNHVQNSAADADAEPGYWYTKGYYTMGATRVRYTIPITRADGSVTDVRHWVIVNSTPQIGRH